jgi:hypothetical protein
MIADSNTAPRPNQGLSIATASRARNRFWMSIAISMLLGGVGGFAVVRYLQSDGSIIFLEKLSVWETLIALPLLMLLVVGVHEFGHLIAGLLQGMRFVLLIIYPFQWTATSKGIRFGIVTNIGQMGGLAVTAPTTVGPKIKRQLACVIAGGPIASLTLAIIASIPVWFLDGRFAGYCQLLSVLSFGCFLLTIIPGEFGGFMTDGMQLIDVFGDSRSMIERGAMMQIMSQSMAGVRPRDWDVKAIAQADLLNSLDMPRRIAAMQVLLYHAMDSLDPEQTRYHADFLKSHAHGFPDGFRQSIYAELAFLAAMEHDTEQATAYLETTTGGIATSESRCELARAALCWAKKDRQGMGQHISAAERAMSRSPAAGFDDLTRDQLANLVTNRIK